MQFHNFLHQRKPDAQSARVVLAASLKIYLEDIRKIDGVDAFAIVADLHDRPFIFL